MKPFILPVILLGLCSCGGGGGGADSSAAAPATAAPVTTTAPTPPPSTTPPVATPAAPITTSDLVAALEMDFSSAAEVAVSVDIGNSGSAFVALYSDYREQGGSYLPNYQQRLSGGMTNNGKFSAQVAVAAGQEHLLIEVWRHDGGSIAQQRLVSLAATEIHWTVD
ncbi:hypothetical protein [uncultured Ferrimonas sp.]|uniref:hypothetical protein n=1 Tax=uncultured Ferrimonas sp. TaxID=432640 RepID=UPI002613C392|nr:hypothetical protein [uncultured Ferrimonas sp.]